MTADRDDVLLAELRRLVTDVDPVPEDVTEFAKAALGWRRIDAELAELLSDSAFESASLASTRSGLARARSITFQAPQLEIELQIEETEPGFLLLGQLAPPSGAIVELHHDDGSVGATTRADDLGRFRIELATGGRIRLRISGIAGVSALAVETSWLTL